MTNNTSTHNMLTGRGISKNTPPSHLYDLANTTANYGVESPLLHKAMAYCGRAFLCLFAAVVSLCFTACDKNPAPTILT